MRCGLSVFLFFSQEFVHARKRAQQGVITIDSRVIAYFSPLGNGHLALPKCPEHHRSAAQRREASRVVFSFFLRGNFPILFLFDGPCEFVRL